MNFCPQSVYSTPVICLLDEYLPHIISVLGPLSSGVQHSDAGTVPIAGYMLPLTSSTWAPVACPCSSEGQQSHSARPRRMGSSPSSWLQGGSWLSPGEPGHPAKVQKPVSHWLLGDLLCETSWTRCRWYYLEEDRLGTARLIDGCLRSLAQQALVFRRKTWYTASS